MKKYISLILSLIFVLPLASCTGIGDGALFKDIATSGAEESTFPLYVDIFADIRDEPYCSVTHYDRGHSNRHHVMCTDNIADEIISMFDNAEYLDRDPESGNWPARFELTVFDGEKMRRFQVDSVDRVYVGEQQSGDVILFGSVGVLEGAYEKLMSLTGVIPMDGDKALQSPDESKLSCLIYMTIPNRGEVSEFVEIKGEDALALFDSFSEGPYLLSGEESGGSLPFMVYFVYEDPNTGDRIETDDVRFNGSYYYYVYDNDLTGYNYTSEGLMPMLGKNKGLYEKVRNLYYQQKSGD